jgi:hypothetical protein
MENSELWQSLHWQSIRQIPTRLHKISQKNYLQEKFTQNTEFIPLLKIWALINANFRIPLPTVSFNYHKNWHSDMVLHNYFCAM